MHHMPTRPWFTTRTARAVLAHVRTSGGVTLDPATGAQPARGYCINEADDRPRIPASEFFTDDTGHALIEAYLTDHGHGIVADGKHLGIWHDKTNDTIILDRVDVVDDLDAATALGRARNQRAMWDATNSQEIALT